MTRLFCRQAEWAGYNGGSRGVLTTPGMIWGGDGADTLLVSGMAEITGDVVGSNNATDTITADLPVQDGALAGDLLNMLPFHEILAFLGGTVNGHVLAGGGNDLIILGGSYKAPDLPEGEDGLVLETTFGEDSYVDGGGGNDTIALLGESTWAAYSGAAPADPTNPRCRNTLRRRGRRQVYSGTRLNNYRQRP